MTVLINSERLGDVDCEESATLTLPNGLLGFEHETTFAVLGVDEDGIYRWLQSTTTPALAAQRGISSGIAQSMASSFSWVGNSR